MDSSKQAYLSPSTGTLDISVIRDARPSATISLDLGIPNFTVFSIKFPLVEDKPSSMSGLIAEAVHTLLDEMSAFMISVNFEQNIIVGIYAAVLTCFKGMTGEADTNKGLSAISKDPTVKTFEGTFKLPMEFVNETYDKVVTAAGKQIKRPPVHRHLELTYEKPAKTTVVDARTVIKNYRSRSLKSQPSPMYIIVYDQMGNARGTIPLGNNFKNQLLNQIYPKGNPKGKKGAAEESKLEFSPTVKFDNDIEMKTTNAEGIPKSIFVGDEQYTPVATISDDMALYASKQEEYVVKFPDGRCVAFTDRPLLEDLKKDNYPVPTVYTEWTDLSEEDTPESSDENEAVDERGTEVIEGTETESNPIVDLKADDDKNEQLEEGVDDKADGAEKTSSLKFAEELWNEKHVVGEFRGYKLVVNSLNHPSYYTVWTPENKKVGYLETRDLRVKGEEFQNVRMVHVEPKYRQQGLGLALYRAMLENLPPEYAGICSYSPDRSNKRFVPRIWKRLGGVTHPDNEDYIIVRKGPNRKKASHYQCECGSVDYDGDDNCENCGLSKEDGHWVGDGGGASGILPICSKTGRICLAWRSGRVHEGNCWGTIGGAIQSGLSPSESAKEELKEETGYRGSIRLIPVFVFTSGAFKYHNFIGVVPTEFELRPMKGGSSNLKFTDETDAIAWFTWEDLQNDIENNEGDYHSGVLQLIKQSGDQIRQICEVASNRE